MSIVAPLPDRPTAPRFVLRRWEVDDVDALAAAVTGSLEHLRPWMPWIEHEPLAREARVELVEGWTRDWEAGGDAFVGFFRDGAVVGGGGLHHRLGPRALEIRYGVHVDHWLEGCRSRCCGPAGGGPVGLGVVRPTMTTASSVGGRSVRSLAARIQS